MDTHEAEESTVYAPGDQPAQRRTPGQYGVIVQVNEQVYCPYHERWEVYLGEDPALCEWCCQLFPCPMHGDGSLPVSDPIELRQEVTIEIPYLDISDL